MIFKWLFLLKTSLLVRIRGCSPSSLLILNTGPISTCCFEISTLQMFSPLLLFRWLGIIARNSWRLEFGKPGSFSSSWSKMGRFWPHLEAFVVIYWVVILRKASFCGLTKLISLFEIVMTTTHRVFMKFLLMLKATFVYLWHAEGLRKYLLCVILLLTLIAKVFINVISDQSIWTKFSIFCDTLLWFTIFL